MTTSSFDRSGRGGRSPPSPVFPPRRALPFDEGQSLAIWRDAYVSEPVLAIDLGPERELHLPESHNREIIPSRPPICCDDVVEEFPRATSGNGDPEKCTGCRRQQSQRTMRPTEKCELAARRYAKELRVGNVQTPDSTLSRRVMKSPYGSTPHAAL